jgi:DNA invertase Pin-like site-specific DNA recombinase
MTIVKWAILAGVSSDKQAEEDKGSIDDQIATCRHAIQQLGGEEVACYIMDGYSRSGYDSLSDALEDIPPLKEAVEAAAENKYDILMLDNFDRLGDLGQLMHTRYKKYKKQLYSARQSGRFHDPATYDPYSDESSSIDMHIQGILQTYRINKLQRGLKLGITKRVETGRYSHAHPYGYLPINDKGDLDLDPPVAQLIIALKDKFFEGKSLRDLKEVADQSGVPSPEGLPYWNYMSIRSILANPFYSGKVFKNRWKVIGKKWGPTGKPYPVIRANPNPTYYDGKHQALWSWDEHLRILTEMQERYHKMSRYNPRAFTGLLICSVCGHRLTFKGGKYRCRPLPDHIHLPEEEAERGIGEALAETLRNYKDVPPEPPSVDVAQKAKEALERKIVRVQLMVEDETYTREEGAKRVQELRARIAATDAVQEEYARKLAGHQRIVDMLQSELIDLDELPMRFMRDEKEITNIFLRGFVESIEVTPRWKYKFNFR